MRQRGINVHRFCEGFGIRVRPIHQAREPRPPNVIYGGRILARMLRKKGPDHTGLVLMCITASDATCLHGDTLRAVSQFLTAHGVADARQAIITDFRAIDLGRIRDRARRAAAGTTVPMARRADAFATLIWNSLDKEAAA